MRTTVHVEAANPKCKKMLERARREVAYCGYKRTAADIGIAQGTLRKMLQTEQASYAAWEKLAAWADTWVI